jgi:hypothetical protein
MAENFRINAIRLVQVGLGVLISMSNHNQQLIESLDGGYDNPALLITDKYMSTIAQAEQEIRSLIELSTAAFQHMQCAHIDHAINALNWWLSPGVKKWSDLRASAITLRDAIDVELKQYIYYQYPKSKGEKVLTYGADWQSVILAFPSSEPDIFSATDCYGLGHNTAAVFHCMRVLEHGLSAMASDVGLNFNIQQWHNIIEQIEGKIAEQRKTLPRGLEKNERLQFLSEVAKEFFYFKDGWRNYVSHNRGRYDEHQALSILEHTRSFMCNLASRLSGGTAQ